MSAPMGGGQRPAGSAAAPATQQNLNQIVSNVLRTMWYPRECLRSSSRHNSACCVYTQNCRVSELSSSCETSDQNGQDLLDEDVLCLVSQQELFLSTTIFHLKCFPCLCIFDARNISVLRAFIHYRALLGERWTLQMAIARPRPEEL